MTGKFFGSFAEEAGKITAKKLLDRKENKREIVAHFKISEPEYNLLKKLIPEILEDQSVNEIIKKTKKKKHVAKS